MKMVHFHRLKILYFQLMLLCVFLFHPKEDSVSCSTSGDHKSYFSSDPHVNSTTALLAAKVDSLTALSTGRAARSIISTHNFFL